MSAAATVAAAAAAAAAANARATDAGADVVGAVEAEAIVTAKMTALAVAEATAAEREAVEAEAAEATAEAERECAAEARRAAEALAVETAAAEKAAAEQEDARQQAIEVEQAARAAMAAAKRLAAQKAFAAFAAESAEVQAAARKDAEEEAAREDAAAKKERNKAKKANRAIKKRAAEARAAANANAKAAHAKAQAAREREAAATKNRAAAATRAAAKRVAAKKANDEKQKQAAAIAVAKIDKKRASSSQPKKPTLSALAAEMGGVFGKPAATAAAAAGPTPVTPQQHGGRMNLGTLAQEMTGVFGAQTPSVPFGRSDKTGRSPLKPSKAEVLKRAFAAALERVQRKQDGQESSSDSVLIALRKGGEGSSGDGNGDNDQYTAEFAGSADQVRAFITSQRIRPAAPNKDGRYSDDDEWEWIDDGSDYLLMEAVNMHQFRELTKRPGYVDFNLYSKPTIAPVLLDTVPAEGSAATHSFRDLAVDEFPWQPAGSADGWKDSGVGPIEPNDRHPDLVPPREFAKVPDMYAWKAGVLKHDQDDAAVLNGLQPNDQHPEQRNPRDFAPVETELDWKDSRGDSMLSEGAPASGLSPNGTAVMPREYSKIDPSFDWQQTGNANGAIHPMPVNTDAPFEEGEHDFRILDKIDPSLDWKHAENAKGAKQRSENSGMEPNYEHPDMRSPRSFGAVPSEVDWKDSRQQGMLSEATPASGMKPNDAPTMPRDYDVVNSSVDWLPSGPGKPPSDAHLHNALEPSATTGKDAFRQLSKMDSEFDWKDGQGAGILNSGSSGSGLEPNGNATAPRDFDIISGDLDWKRAGIASADYREDTVLIDHASSREPLVGHSFRASPPIPNEVVMDFQRVGKGDSTIEEIGNTDFEPNATHPSMHAPRSLDILDNYADWQDARGYGKLSEGVSGRQTDAISPPRQLVVAVINL